MKWIFLMLAICAFGAVGCAWLRPPEPNGMAQATNAPAVVSPVSGVSGAGGDARAPDSIRR